MQVKDIMVKELFVVDKDDMVSYAIELMVKKRVSRLLVVDKGKLVGVITEKDMVDRLGSSKMRALQASSVHISGVMSDNPITITPQTDVVNSAKIMIDKHISSLPVVEKEELVGIITKSTMTRLCLKIDHIFVGQIMTKSPITTTPFDRIMNVRRIMLEKDISSLPVLDDGKLVGIITEGHIALYLAEFREKVPEKHQEKRIKHVKVTEVMQKDPPLLHPDNKVSEAADLMRRERVKSIPIINYEERLIGVLTKTDLTKLVANKFILENN
ncbi:MAG: CBS domain-containing protein [Candidatus Jordarchaeum sp.]|uniref:CBS domain-containing protein n=1 Tax=Candidatus Jordarchaeum sp. TaxID=2823881 RepID=UPI00404B75A1